MEAAAEIDVGVAVVEIAIRQQQRVAASEVDIFEKGRVVAAAGEGCG